MNVSTTPDFITQYRVLVGWTGDYLLLILACWLIFVYVLLEVVQRVLHFWLPTRFGQLSHDQQRATSFKVVECTTGFVFTIFMASLLVKRFILQDYPDMLGVQGERVFALFLMATHIIELFYRNHIRVIMVVHHLTTLINISLAIGVPTFWTRTYSYFLSCVGFFNAATFLLEAAMIMYRLEPKSSRTYRLIQAVTIQELIFKILQQGISAAILIWGAIYGDNAGVEIYQYVISFGSFILFMPAQFYGSYVMWCLWRKLKQQRHADSLHEEEEVAS